MLLINHFMRICGNFENDFDNFRKNKSWAFRCDENTSVHCWSTQKKLHAPRIYLYRNIEYNFLLFLPFKYVKFKYENIDYETDCNKIKNYEKILLLPKNSIIYFLLVVYIFYCDLFLGSRWYSNRCHSENTINLLKFVVCKICLILILIEPIHSC